MAPQDQPTSLRPVGVLGLQGAGQRTGLAQVHLLVPAAAQITALLEMTRDRGVVTVRGEELRHLWQVQRSLVLPTGDLMDQRMNPGEDGGPAGGADGAGGIGLGESDSLCRQTLHEGTGDQRVPQHGRRRGLELVGSDVDEVGLIHRFQIKKTAADPFEIPSVRDDPMGRRRHPSGETLADHDHQVVGPIRRVSVPPRERSACSAGICPDPAG